MIRVGFVFAFDDGWLGGVNYFRNLLTALYDLPDRQIEVVIFTSPDSPDKHFEGFPPVKIVRSRLFKAGSLPCRIRYLVRYGFSRDLLFEWLLKRYDISVLSHFNWLIREAKIPTIGWIADFQHVRLPEFFSVDEIAERNNNFSDVCRFCSTIIVSSFDALADLKRFSPKFASKSRVLQFAVASDNAEINLPGRNELEEKYKFSGKYFLLPNQFWKHKNHRVVINALGLLRRSGRKVQVIATGSKEDYRHPDFFDSLMAHAKELEVLDDFHHLGLVPSADLAGLMRGALAIINPSLFEGWSTTVEEAKTLGKQILLSDIPVHREQNPALAGYFLPDDAKTLADLFWAAWNDQAAGQTQTLEEARSATEKRRIEFARNYQSIVLDTLEHHPR